MLPLEFRPSALYNLIRLGQDNDGGYLVGANAALKSEYIVSFGINDDWSFEEQFKKYNPKIKILAFDPNVTNTFFIWRIWFSILSLLRAHPKFFYNNIKKWLSFKKFFNKEDNKFFLNKIGRGGLRKPLITIDEIIKMTNGSKNIFFKIDIEGSEYRILDDIIKNSDCICGIVIEFHDIDLHLEKIQNFIANLKLKLIHIHANNCGEPTSLGMPVVIELTFDKDPDLINEAVSFPHKLDQRNDPKFEDIELLFHGYNH